ncbi:MAG: right-handed parallel beta-helix repeat-containing protein [Clostridia bacterium]|nr:right-handed parallel beta-helix repeat-containing protein [Clostridia bacterium]
MKAKLLTVFLCLCMLASVSCGAPDAETTATPEQPSVTTPTASPPETPEQEDETTVPLETTAPETDAPPKIPFPTDHIGENSVGLVYIKTNSGTITGAKDVTVPRPDKSGRTLSAEGYLSPANSGDQNLRGFADLLAQIQSSYSTADPYTTLSIPSGTYRIKSYKQFAIHLKELHNLCIDGGGSLFLLEDSDRAIGSAALFGLEYCDTVEFRNFSIDFDWESYPLYVIGEVISADTETQSVTFHIDSHKLPSQVKIGGGRSWDPSIDNRSDTVGFIPYGSVKSSEVLDEHTLRVYYSAARSAKDARPGQQFQFYFQPNFKASAFRMLNNKNVTLDSITIYSAPYEAAWNAAGDGYHIVNCKVIPAEGRLFSTYTGFETHSVKGNVIVENCEMMGVLDDNIHLSNHFMGGENVKIDDYTVEMRHLQTFSFKHYFVEGTRLALYDKNHRPLGYSSVIESVTSLKEGVNDMATYTVRFRDPLPQAISPTDIFMTEDYYDGSFIIRNNRFSRGLCHALYLGLSNGTVENNTFDNFAYPSLILTTVTRWERWHIGGNVENVVIRGNTMTRCNTAGRDPASLAVVAGRDAQPTDFTPADGYVIRNVLVENNVVDGSTGSAFALFSAEDVFVRNNTFLNSNLLPTTKPRRVGWGNAYVSNARNITWENNEIHNEGHAYENGLYVDTATVLNFEEKE